MKVLAKGKEIDLFKCWELMIALTDTFPTGEAIDNFMFRDSIAFFGRRPIDLFLEGEFDKIRNELMAIQEGVHS